MLFRSWTPQILVSAYLIAGNLGLAPAAIATFGPYAVAIAFEMIVTALGVADRFMIIKRERDRAHNNYMARERARQGLPPKGIVFAGSKCVRSGQGTAPPLTPITIARRRRCGTP